MTDSYVRRLWIVIALGLIVHCRCVDLPGDSRIRVRSVVPPVTEHQVEHIVRTLPGWPTDVDPVYEQTEWDQFLQAAYVLQNQDSSIVAGGLRHFSENARASSGRIGEWSKALVLLRVMFVVPDALPSSVDEDINAMHEPIGNGFSPILIDERSTEASQSIPVLWTVSGPVLAAKLGAFSGPDYRPDLEYAIFRRHLDRRIFDLGEDRKLHPIPLP